MSDRCRTVLGVDTADRARELLARFLGPEARFRDGQLEAIEALVDDRRRVLVVQRTGWGKSIVYLIATRLLREDGAGPSLVVSPLLALMRNQTQMGERIEGQTVILTTGTFLNGLIHIGFYFIETCKITIDNLFSLSS